MHPLLDQFESVCRDRQNQLAVADPTAAVTYGELRAIAGGLASRIRQTTDRQHVGLLAPSSAAGTAAILACWYAERVPVPLNFMASPRELARIVADAELDLVLTAPALAAMVSQMGLKTLLLDSQTLTGTVASAPDGRPVDLAVILYTSGTVGDPKGVCLSFNNLLHNANACIAHARISADLPWLGLLPQFHSFGFTATTVTPLLLGATIHYLPRFSPQAAASLVAEKRIRILIGIPSMLAAIASLKSVTRDMLSSLELVISGGESLPQWLYQTFSNRLGITIYEGYGLTEASPVVSLNTPWANRPGSVGKPIPGVSVAAVDGGGRPLPAGTAGELVIRGPGVMLGYYNKPEQTAAAIRDGALYSGDVGYVDADGYVFITGRAKEMIIVAGENVFPREIEEVLRQHPTVAEAAVVGVPDRLRGEVPAAFVILKAGYRATPTELREHCRSHLAGYKVPRIVRVVEDLPRSPTGKVLKRSLCGLLEKNAADPETVDSV